VNWKRFSSDQYASFIRGEVQPIREFSPGVPVTTNLMGTHEPLDYWRLAAELDFVSMDAYPSYDANASMVDVAVEHSFVYDLMRSFKPGRPWLLMECTPSSANWMPVMKLKRPGIHMLTAMQAVAHGSDAVLYFQWRQGLGGREKFHGAVLDHTGSTDTRVFREVAEVGSRLEGLAPVLHSTRRSDIAVIYDWENRWAIHASCGPARDHKDYLPTCLAHYRPLWQGGWPADVIQSTCDFSSYRVLIAPMLAMLRPGVAERLEAFVAGGGTLIGTYWSGLVDEDDRLFETPFPGPLAHVFGIQNEETDILHPAEQVSVQAESGNSIALDGVWEARTFCALIRSHGAEVLATYGSEFYAGSPAITCNRFGLGCAYYIAFRGDERFLTEFTAAYLGSAGFSKPWDLPAGVTVQIREIAGEPVCFFLNFTNKTQCLSFSEKQLLEFSSGDPLQAIDLAPYGFRIAKIGIQFSKHLPETR
jgi:beta-galactosidase